MNFLVGVPAFLPEVCLLVLESFSDQRCVPIVHLEGLLVWMSFGKMGVLLENTPYFQDICMRLLHVGLGLYF